MLYLILFIIITLFITFNKKETFFNINSLYPNTNYLISKDIVVKDDKYVDFLSDINSKYIEKEAMIINNRDVVIARNSALDFAFGRQPDQSPQEQLDQAILNPHDPALTTQTDVCQHRAASLCTRTDPNMYIASNVIRFPPRWIFPPYANMPLPMKIDINCYDEIYNCCKKKF